jgi:hypothetical protein
MGVNNFNPFEKHFPTNQLKTKTNTHSHPQTNPQVAFNVTRPSQPYAQNPYYKINENKNSKFTLIIVISFLILSSVTVGIIFGTKEGFCIDDDPRIFIVILLILIIYLILYIR